MGVGQQGSLAELLGYPEDASTEVDCRWGVLWEEGGQAQQTRGLPQTLKVFWILRQPRAKHRAHRSAQIRREIFNLSTSSCWFRTSRLWKTADIGSFYAPQFENKVPSGGVEVHQVINNVGSQLLKAHLLKDCLIWLLSLSPGGFSNLLTNMRTLCENVVRSPSWLSFVWLL